MLENYSARYLTLDDAGVLAAAEADPTGFLAGLEGQVVLDEVQRAPALFPAIKAEVDRDRQAILGMKIWRTLATLSFPS
jgi:predicted AAA+ superfamily ATPase